MEIIRDIEKTGMMPDCAATIGVFDGVHGGHRQVIRRLISDAQLHHLASMVITFDNPEYAQNVQVGMSVDVGASHATIFSVGTLPDGAPVAHAETWLADGTYSARVSYRQTQVLKLLFN